jgi:hypothetical protein
MYCKNILEKQKIMQGEKYSIEQQKIMHCSKYFRAAEDHALFKIF